MIPNLFRTVEKQYFRVVGAESLISQYEINDFSRSAGNRSNCLRNIAFCNMNSTISAALECIKTQYEFNDSEGVPYLCFTIQNRRRRRI